MFLRPFNWWGISCGNFASQSWILITYLYTFYLCQLIALNLYTYPPNQYSITYLWMVSQPVCNLYAYYKITICNYHPIFTSQSVVLNSTVLRICRIQTRANLNHSFISSPILKHFQTCSRLPILTQYDFSLMYYQIIPIWIHLSLKSTENLTTMPTLFYEFLRFFIEPETYFHFLCMYLLFRLLETTSLFYANPYLVTHKRAFMTSTNSLYSK